MFCRFRLQMSEANDILIPSGGSLDDCVMGTFGTRLSDAHWWQASVTESVALSKSKA